MSVSYWLALQELLAENSISIDRPSGRPHPHYPDLIYPLDYGFVENTSSGDGAGIDVWIGTLNTRKLTGILCTFDTVKRDAEVKLLCGCTDQDVQKILSFNNNLMGTIYIPNPEANK